MERLRINIPVVIQLNIITSLQRTF